MVIAKKPKEFQTVLLVSLPDDFPFFVRSKWVLPAASDKICTDWSSVVAIEFAIGQWTQIWRWNLDVSMYFVLRAQLVWKRIDAGAPIARVRSSLALQREP